MTTIQSTTGEKVAVATPVVSRLRARLAVVLASHTAVDVFSVVVPPIIGLLEVRCELERSQTALLMGIGPISSGLSQPVTAWLSDRFDSRLFAPLGLIIAAVCLSFIGLATNFASLVALYFIGMAGVGMYHPVGASSMGHLSGQLDPQRRSLGISVFFVAGMIGGVTGAVISPWITASDGGFVKLRLLAIPGVLIALALVAAIRRTPHRDGAHTHATLRDGEGAARWRMIAVLYVSNAMRFTVNIALFYLYVRWAQTLIAEAGAVTGEKDIAEAAAPISGQLIGCTMAGMAIGGVTAGSLVRVGRERWPMVLVPILIAPLIAMFPFVGRWGAYALAISAGIGFASMMPVAISLSQRLLPHRTSLASGLMMGGAWSVALLGPMLAEYMLMHSGFGLTGAFTAVAVLLGASGLVCMLLDRRVLAGSAVRRVVAL